MAKNPRNDDSIVGLPDGRSMAYTLYGDPAGRPLLAIHGTPGSRIMMQPAAQFASQNGLLLIAPDRPNYGLSSQCRNYSYAQWTADIKVLLDALKIDQFWVFGVSGGGPFATAIAALMPHRVVAMALVSPVGLFDQQVRQGWSWRHYLLFGLLPCYRGLTKPVFSIARLLMLLAPTLFLKIFAFGLAKPDRLILNDPRHQKTLLAAFREGLQSGVDGVLEDLHLFANPWRLPLEDVHMPVIVWHGTNDLMVPEEASCKLAHSFLEVEMIELAGHGHFWIFDHFEDVLKRLMALPRKDDPAQRG